MHRDDRGNRRWRRREQDVELWGRPIERSDWERGTYGPPEFDRSRGRGPAWDRGEAWGGSPSRATEWDRGDWDRQDRGGWQRSPSYEWQGQQPGWRRPPMDDWDEGMSRGPWAGQAYADNWTEPRTGAAMQRHWHGRTVMKGFERTDDRIREEICSRMCEHPAIDTADMQVTVQNGEVTLEGSVDDRFEKRLAEDLAEGVPGVRDVHNRLRTSGHEHNQERGGHEHNRDHNGHGQFEHERVGTEHDAA